MNIPQNQQDKPKRYYSEELTRPAQVTAFRDGFRIYAHTKIKIISYFVSRSVQIDKKKIRSEKISNGLILKK